MIGLEIKSRRMAADKSVRELAKDCCISPGYLSNIENGTRPCTLSVATALDRVLTQGQSLASLVKEPVNPITMHPAFQIGRNDVDRRSFMTNALVTGAVTATGVAVGDTAFAAHHADAGSATTRSISASQLESIKSFAKVLHHADESSGGGIGKTAVNEFFATDIKNLCDADFDTPEVKSDAFDLASQVAFLCAWKAHDIGDENNADSYYASALELAKNTTADNEAFILWGMAVQSYDTVKVHSEKKSISYAQRSSKYAAKIGGHVQALSDTTLARVYAEAGDTAKARKVLTRIDAELNTDAGGDVPELVAQWCPHKANVLNQAGRVAGLLGAWDDAVDYTVAARDLWDKNTHARAWGMDTYLVGKAYFHAGDEAEAENQWRKGIEVMAALDSQRCRDRITQISEYMPHLVDEFAGK